MAIYHLSLKAIQRSKGRSSTASAAYRSRAKITDFRTGQTYDYTRKKGIEARAIFTPDGSQISREELWNLAEAAEKRKDGITAREYELALPSELNQEQRKELTKNFCLMLSRRYGVAGDAAIHNPTKDGDQRNFHAHILITTRRFKNGHLEGKTDFDLSGRDRQKKGLKSQKEELEDIRQEWESMVNHALEKAGCPERVSRKSLEEQGLNRPATVHLGVAATAMERKGIQTDRGDLNRWPILRKLYAELVQVKKEMRAMEANIAQMRSHEGMEDGREAPGNNQDERTAERGREPESTNSPAAKASPTKEAARSGFPAPAANVGSKRTVQPNQIPTGRVKESAKGPGRAEARYSGNQGAAGRNVENSRTDLPGAERISGERQAGGLPSSQDSSGKDRTAGRTDRDDLGGIGEDRRSSWLERWRQLEELLIRRLIEYRTIGDLLAMNEGREKEKKTQKEEVEVKNSQKCPK